VEHLSRGRGVLSNRGVTSDYRLSPILAARLLGVGLLLIGLLVCLVTLVVGLLGLPVAVLTVAVVLAVVGVFGAGLALTRRAYVVRLGDEGYGVRFVRGAGVKQARWKDVDDAVTADVAGSPCVVLRLRDGRSTTIPVEVLAVDREAFVRDIQTHLRDGQGLRPLG